MKEILNYIKLYTGCNEHALKRIEAILEPRLQPVVVEKIVHVEKILVRAKKPKIPIDTWSQKYFQENNTSYEYISQKRRLQEIVDERDAFVKYAYLNGYRPTEISRYLKRNHTTILHTIRK
jgi:chromosomal replication initiation ATPase DnaA